MAREPLPGLQILVMKLGLRPEWAVGLPFMPAPSVAFLMASFPVSSQRGYPRD
jgi:hypothetical protein